MRFPFWASLLTVIGTIILCGLGFWQMERLKWKAALLANIEKEYALDAKSRALSSQNFVSMEPFQRGILKGQFFHDKSIRLIPRTYKGQIGFHLLTPFKLSEGEEIILVNRGFVPNDKNGIFMPEGLITITGMLRDMPEDNFFVPSNVPEKNQWYRIDLVQIGVAHKITLLPAKIFVLEEDVLPLTDSFPVPVAVLAKPNNHHAQYAMFWFTMAISLICIYIIRFMKNKLP